MSSTQPNENVKLTFDQLQQIDTVEKRLVNLQSEISIGRDNLTAIRLECEKVTKERLYQEELLAEITKNVEVIQGKHTDVLNDLQSTSDTLLEVNKKIGETTDLHTKKETALVEKENKIKEQEEELNKKVEDFTNKSSRLLEDQLSIKTAKDAFLKATETVVW